MKTFLYIGLYLLSTINSHSYLTKPISRTNQLVTQTGCRGPQCLGPCDAPKSRIGQVPIVNISLGDTVELIWPRNNHAAGFIRVAWAPTEKSDDPEAFNQRIQQWSCHEATCQSSNPNDPLGGDSDGQAPGKCTTTIKVPPQLTSGDWTLQWVWVGGAYALGDYYSCVDYKVQNGSPSEGSWPKPVFRGGDVHFPNQQKCMFFNANDVGICKNEPCTTGNLPGQHSGAPKGFEGLNSSQPATTTLLSSTSTVISTPSQTSVASISNSTSASSTTSDQTTQKFSLKQTFSNETTGETFYTLVLNQNLFNDAVSTYMVTLSLPQLGNITDLFGALSWDWDTTAKQLKMTVEKSINYEYGLVTKK